jgi:hypothetical protein
MLLYNIDGHSAARRTKIKINYLNNKDILKEIHLSKISYCSFDRPEHANYDIILPGLDQLNDDAISQARQNRADRLSKESASSAEPCSIDAMEIPVTDLVFRVTTWDHIPQLPPKNPIEAPDDDEVPLTEYDDAPEPLKAATKYVKVNFPPFFHYKLDESGMPYVVGKSHWQGALDSGEFSRDHGKYTDKLALMFMKLCERYATRSNWRNYTYNDEMRSQALLQLSYIGLRFDESKSQNPFAYYTAAITNSFTRVLNIEKRNQNIRDDILEMNNFNPSYTRQNDWRGGGGYED